MSAIQQHLAALGARSPLNTAQFEFPCGQDTVSASIGELVGTAEHLAAALAELPAQTFVVLALPHGPALASSLLACLMANLTAVPLPVDQSGPAPQQCARIGQAAAELAGLGNCVTLADTASAAGLRAAGWSPAQRLLEVERLAAGANGADGAAATGVRGAAEDDLALVLFSSGSGAAPKAVGLSHENLWRQIGAGAAQWAIDADSTVLSWLSPSHNFGLHFGLLVPLFQGARCRILDAQAFMARPRLLFDTIAACRATHFAAPNFVLDLCADALAGERWDGTPLASLSHIVCGGEPVRRRTVERFNTAFGVLGLGAGVIRAHYGLSETGAICTRREALEPAFLALDAAALQQGVLAQAEPGAATLDCANCGALGDDIAVRIVTDHAPSPDGRLGEIWVRSASVARNYLGAAADQAQSFGCVIEASAETGFFRTGDLGFVRAGCLYVAGREKEVMIVRGKNHFPADLEASIAAATSAQLTPVVFGVEHDGAERIVALLGSAAPLPAQTLAALAAAVRQQLATRHGVALHDLAFGSSAELRGAQTGKLNRRLVRQAYLAGALALQRLDGGAAEAPGPAGPALAGMIERLRREAFTPVLGAAAQALGEATPFGEAGLDSLQSLRLAGLIAERWALPFAPTQLFRLQNLREVALHLLGQDAGAAAGAPAAAGPRQVGGDGGGGEPIALVAMHGEFPGAAPGLDGFWELLRSGGDAIGLIEQQRPALWEALLAYPGQQRSRLPRWAGLLEQVDCFDAAFFGISRREAECMDPQQRKVLELLWTLAESAGQRPSSWSGQNIGLFVGAHATDYAEVLAARPDLMAHSGAYMDSGTHLTMIANRASRWFNLNGPSEVINTACSSSLVALHRAVASLRKGESSSAIVVGINLILTPRILLASAAAGMLAADGRCKTLDARADGFVRAEGIGAVMLKPLARALADGDHIHGCIRAVGVNHDGRSNSLRAPNGQAQSRLLVSAYRDAGIDMASIGYLELHGTGTALGDPIEVQAIQQAFATLGAASAPGSCALGSVKSNIGHAEAAAGMAGLLKVMLSFRHETLPATRHIASLNPHITLDGGRLQVLHTARPWPENAGADAQPRRAGLSSFGFGGANAHAVLEAYPQPRTEARSGQGGAALVILSAKTGERLQAQARQLCDWLAAREADGVDLDAVAYTLQVGRDAMPCRLGLVAASASELQQRLRDWLRGDATLALATLAPGASAPAPAQPPALHDAAGCAAALELWLAGAALDWEGMARPCTPQRIALPTYPFLKERHWVPPAPAGGTERAQLHPLLHRNTSDLRAQRYSSRFDGSEFFLDQHRIDGVPVLPASAHLELARAAVALAHGDAGAGVGAAAPVLLEQIKFVRPLALSGGALEVHIELRAQPDGAIAFEIRSGHGADSVLHSQGRALGGATPAAALDLATLRATVRGRAPSPSECYAAFGAAGLDLGASFNCLRQLALGPDQHGRMTLLADLVLPQEAERGGFGLHPALLDGALQATLGLQRAGAGGAQALPFALHSLQFLRPLPEQLSVVVRYSPGSGPDSALQQFDIDLHAADGALCASLRQLSSRAAPSAWTLVPGWQQLAGASGPAEPGPAWPGADAAPVLIGAARHVAELTRLYPRARQLVLAPGDSVAQIGAQLRALGPLDHLLWLAPALAPELTSEALLSAQAEGVFSALRLVKALLARDDGAAPLGLTIITQQCAALGAGDPIRPAHAALHGLFGTLAKEAPRWQVRLIDLPEQQPWPAWPELLAQPADPQGAPLLYRDGLWYRPCMRHARLPVPAAPPYRQGGVYVVLGGAGGIGATWSEHLIRNYQAQVVWIGRRPQDQAISEHMRRLGQYGPAPHYISADATDGAALRAAWEEIDARYGVVNGVVLSTIVLRDQALGRMDEDDFAAALGAKLDVAVRLAQVLAGRPHPDFVLFFSSLQSASKARGQANYASACVAGDAFASAWAREGMPVKIVNWGYWGSVGIVASPDYRRRMAQLGMGSIEAQEAMAVLDRLLTLPLPQLAFLRTTGGSAGADLLLHADEAIEVLDAAHSAVPVPLEVLQQRAEGVMAPQQAARELAYAQQLEQMLARLLDGQLRALGVDDATRLALPGWQGWAGLGTLQRRWLEHSVRMLTQLQQQQQEQEQEQEQQGNQAAAVPLAGLWEEWRSFCAEAGREPSRAAQLTLLDVTLHALPDILAGRRRAVDVLFPHGALTLVEGIYKHNPVADYHNQALSDSLAAYIEQRPAHAAPLRILEIGAGTGGTSALLLERLKQYPGQLAEYCYSDVSPVFLQHAEQHYAPGAPWLRTALFDVERAPAEQGLACGSYDLVIATNVLHATRNLHRSLRHAKALLKRNGLLLLNEISTSMLATHLSFGLLDGWWRYEDAALRLAGTPALTADSWRRVLQDEGYAVLAHPAHPAGDLGHQIVLAQSDGVLCLAEASVPAPAMPDAVAAVAAVASVATATSVEAALPAAARDSDAAGARQLHLLALGHFGRIVADVLKIEPATIDPLGRLEDYGMDSIVIVELTSMLQTSFSWLDGSVLFEGQSIDALVTALIEHDAAAVWRWVGATAPATAAPPLRAQATRRFQQLLAGLLGTTAEQVDPRQPLGECGIDSIIIVELTEALQALFPSVDSSLLFDTQSIDSLVELFVRTEPEALAAWAAPQAAAPTQPPEDIPAPLPMSVPMPMPMSLPVPVPAAAPPTGKQDVAIVGLSGRYPQAATLDAMWDLLREGRSGITQVPAQRWAADDGGAGAGAACAWGGFIDGVDEFDPGFFGLSAEQARNMDPQERLFLQQAHASIEDAGYTPAALGRGGRVGVFAGVMHGYYPSGASYWSIANRTSFLFNFDGPSMALDSACSSSLTALHVALDSLAAGSCDIALVGGVNLIIDPRHLACLAEANMLSSGDKCRAFGDLADGFVDAEGCGVMVLKRLDRALADGDHVHAVVKGSMINAGGKTVGYGAPSPTAQEDVVRRAMTAAGVDPRTVSYVEAHGTGTLLGDAVEVAGLSRVFRDGGQQPGFCALGSVKSNLGHAESAAGMAAITKTVLQMRHGQFAPSLHARAPNPLINFAASPFKVVQELTPWQRPRVTIDGASSEYPRRAGVSAFGGGGANAHVVLEEYLPAATAAVQPQVSAEHPALIVLSARSDGQLREQVEQLLAWAQRRELGAEQLASLAYTLQVGRGVHCARLALLASDQTQLTGRLRAWLDQAGVAADLFYASADGASAAIAALAADDDMAAMLEQWIAKRKYAKLLDWWVKGLEIDWTRLYGADKPRRLSAPTYPFARERYWIDGAPAPQPPATPTPAPVTPAAPGARAPGRAKPHVAPSGPVEATLARLWQELLAVEAVGAHDSFFELGGNSLRAMQLVARIRTGFDVEFPVAAMLDTPQLDAMAAHIAQLQREGAGAAAPITRAERGEALPLAYQQERLWFVHEHMPEQRTSYNIVVAAHFHGTDFSAAAMAAAYQDLLARHEVLRTRFVFDAASNAARQVIAPTLQLDIAQRDIAAEALPALIGAAAADCVDLAQGPLLKVALLRLSDEHHVVLSTIHHIVSDGWSQGVIAHDLRQLYAARRGAPAAALAPLAVQYADYAAWQRRQDMSAHLAYWSGALAGYVDGIELPYDAARGAGRTWRAAVVEHHYSPQLAGALASFSQARQCTLFVTLLCALAVVLQRYSGRDDLCIGTTVAGRERAELEHLVGFFINILPLRLDLAGAPDLAGLLEHVRQVVLRGFDHQALPFEHLLNALRGQRDSSQIPLVPVLLRHQNFPAETERAWAGGLLAGKIEVGGERTTPSELDWQFHGDANALSVTLEYAADLFSRDTIERMIAHHQQVLEAMLADAGQPVRGLVLLTGHEQRLYADLNATARAHPPAPGLAARFARQAAAHPHALACVGLADGAAPPMTLTYGVLAARAGQLARRLQTLGAGPDTRVAVVCERAPELLVALLAILHTGACYVPVDPHYPQHYIAQILDDARPDLLLCQRALATRLPANHPATAWLDLDDAGRLGDPGLADLEPAAAAAPERPDQLACLMYTSGSTGRPKGVMVPYGQIGNWLEAAWERAPFLRDEMMLHKTSICFAVSVKELLSALLAGAPQLMLPDSHVKDSAALAAAIAHWRVTRLHLVPSHLQALLDSVADDSTALASLQQVVCAGEALPAALRARLRQRLPQVALWNNYGCTELNDVSYYRPDGPAAGPSVPIGYPISNTSVYVLDAQLREVALGVMGELHVASIGMARGYWASPALTAERFIANPFGDAPGTRLYKTGDMVRRLADGALEYLGRRDYEVKIRGHRVDLRQVEQALLSHPQVSQALVTGWPPAAASSTQLAAYLVAGGDGTPAPEALRQHLAARLPTYMLPTSYSMLDALPRLPNGKLDRLNLPAPDLPAAREDYRAPATPAESRLAAIFSAVLQIDRVGAHDNFFNLGGHSLLATQLVGLVQQEFGVALAIATLFQHPTVAALADDLHRLSNGAGAAGPDAAAGAPITPVPRSERLLPSFAQERMWFLHHFVKGAPYNTPALALLNGEIDHAVLEAALRGVIARHEALRTNFTERDDTLYQVVGSAERFTLPLEQVADHAQLDLAIAAASTQPFDLEHELLLRARLFRVSAHVHYLFVTIHHIVFDGWSTAILLRELGLHYACISGATAASALPPPLALQYPDYAQWERRHFDPARLAPGLAYWQSRLDGAQALILPTDAARPPLQDFSGALIGIDIPADLLDRLQGLSARHGATLYMTLLAAFSVLLGRHAGQDDFCIGSPIANRDQPQVRELIGLFVNTLALRVRPQPALSFEELLQQVRQSALEAYAHQEVPFEKIVEALELPRDTARSPLVQVMFNFQHGAAGLELPGLAVAPLMLHNGAAKFEITLDLTLSNGALSGFFEYASALFSEASMRRLSSQFLALLEAAVSAPRSAVGALPLAGPPERSAAPDASTPQPPPAVAGVTLTHQLFEQYAASHPGRIAVAEPTGVLSYAALNARANRIGAWLRAQGVQRGTLVGLCARHSSALLAAVLGIAKAGAALVLIDPNAGPDAAYALLYESGLAIVLTETGLRAGLPTDDQLVACLDDASDPFAACADDNLAPWPEAAEQLAYVDYSPDADGQLRGAMVSHQALLGAVLAWRARHALGERHRFLLQAPLAGRLVIGELFLWFACGASVQVAADGADAPAADVLFLTPDQLAALISAERALATPAAFPQLLLCGPDPVPRGLAAKLAALAPHCTLAPLYAFAGVVLGLCAAAPEGGAAHGYTLPLGEAAHGARFQVRDGYRRPCAIGIAGELYLGGTGLAHGYLNDRAASAADFVTDPDGSSWYRSGQCARLLSDGTLEWLGQFPPAPTQRVELARIEAALLELPIVSHAIATLRSDGSVVAHLIPDQAGFDAHFAATPASASTSASASDPAPDPDPAELGARAAQPQVEAFVHLALARHLPDYMQPAALVWMAQFPLQDDGRTARSNLPAAPAAASAERPYLAPRSALEQSLGAVMQTVLKVSRVGLHDSFFDLGGHSVLAIQLVYGVRKALGIDIPVTLVFEAPLLETLAARIAQLQREGAGAAAPITRAERGEALPLAYQQERLWFVHEHMPEQRTSYNIVVAAHFHGTDFSAAAMAAAYQDLLARHEVLRTRFVFDAAANAARQVIAPTLQLDIAQRDIAAETLPALIGAAAADCVDLARGPLLKVALLRLSDEHHVVLSTIHHIVSDGWSQGVIAHDLRQLYAARRGAPAAALAPLAVQYADYAAWQRRQDMSAHLAYWSGALAGYVDGIELPYDAARGAGRTWRAAVVEHHYSPQLAGALASFSQARQCTLFVTLLCALVVVLQRYSGRDDLCIGTTVAGRERAELEHLVGFFINILPLRLDLAGAPDLAGLLEHVRQVVLRGFDHQALPFEHLLNALRGQRDSSQIPLVPVLLRHQNFPAETERAWAGGLLAGKIEVGGERTTPSELDWQFHGDANALSVTLEYAADLFSRDTIERMIAHHQQVLEAMLADAGQPVRGLVLLTGHEQRLYADLNATARAHPPAPGLAARFARQAAAHPHALACVGLADGAAPPMTLTYGVLAARAGQLARRLQTLGAGPDTRVAVVCERAPELLVALLAILHTGACYVPVDPHYPQHYIAQILDDARPDLLLCQRALATRLPANHPATAWLDLDDAGRLGDPGLADLEPAAAAAPERPDQLACLMYTSGSTGRPKGVMVPYGQIGNWLEAAWERAPFLRDEMMLHKTSICFAVSVKELLSALLAGAPQLMLPDSHVKDSAALAAAIAHWRVTRLHLVPSHLQALLDSVADDSTALASLQQVVCAGEALPAALRARLRQRLPQVALWNNYGCTELNDVSYYQPDGPAAGPSVPIGYPISNTSVYVLDAQLREVALGVMGELHVASIGMARGYWASPALTAERFIANPFGDAPGTRLYKTGDMVRRLADGALEYLGRRDYEVKIRGHRVDLRQVEQALLSHPQVSQALVTGWPPAAASSTQLAAYLVAGGDGTPAPAPEALRQHLAARLPTYMLPTSYSMLDALPRLPNGKLDRLNLPAPDLPAAREDYRAPATPAESRLAAIFSAVLQIDRVGAHDNFFNLGGHSLLATQLISRIRQEFALELPMSVIFETPVLAALAAELQARQDNGTQAPLKLIRPVGREQPIPLSFFQERLWFVHQHMPEQRTSYNGTMALRLRGPLSVAAMQAAFQALAERHETLRTTFAIGADGSTPLQVIDPAPRVQVALQECDEAGVLAAMDACATHQYDLGTGPLLKVQLLRLSDEHHVLLIGMHHLIYDGWSQFTVMSRDVPALYAAALGQRPAVLPALPIQYADYAVWQRGQDFSADLAFWRRTLDGYQDGLQLPYDFARPPGRNWHAATVGITYPADLAARFTQFHQASQSTLFIGLLASFAIVLHQYTGRDDICIGTTTAGRNQLELEDLIGFFINILPLRLNLAGDPDIAELMRRTRQVVLQAFEHQALPFEHLLNGLNKQRDSSQIPLVPVILRHQNFPSRMSGQWNDGLSIDLIERDERATPNEIDLQFYGDGSYLEVHVEYAAELFSAATIHRMIAHHQQIMELMLATVSDAG